MLVYLGVLQLVSPTHSLLELSRCTPTKDRQLRTHIFQISHIFSFVQVQTHLRVNNCIRNELAGLNVSARLVKEPEKEAGKRK